MAIWSKLNWTKAKVKNQISLSLLFVCTILLSVFILKKLDIEFLTYTLLLSSSFFLFFTSLKDFFNNKFINLPQNISHFGFSLLILSILFNNLFSTETITNLKVGETFENTKTKIVFENISQKEEKNYKSIIAKFIIQDSKGKIENLSPELRIYNQPNIVTSEADIKTKSFSMLGIKSNHLCCGFGYR